MSTNNLTDPIIEKERRFESFSGVILAIFAALLAVTNLGGSKFDSDKIIGTNEKTNVYAWYQSKSLKQDMLENQRDLIGIFIKGNYIQQDKLSSLNSMLAPINSRIESYSKEKRELLLGSKAVGKENWVQEKNGEYGKIIGALEWEKTIQRLGQAGGKFDIAVLFLELCLVIGAISLVMHNERLRIIFIAAMITLGLIGMLYGIQGFILAISR
ncbi:MAG: Acyl-CoA dehydrogenase [Candidatus Magnetoglobus multicellularis str. Araruama]|uniref:Acyl-CoA dehydrogenase n=1 Tax=Candidatus Magnetoglobus multicellularis str. Araruama TaxID=890399 RepID=A0A1V1PBF4_9BACT|nr:MAG: Acyl-CoA dehydrogenase [Candidatus Magnetoglobus multicellularis str. Araruama]